MPTSVTLTVGEVLNASAALMNDAVKSVYTNAIQMPYINMALRELQELFELNNVPVTDTVTDVEVTIPAGIKFVGFSPDMPVVGTPYLPDDLIEPKVVWERSSGVNPYTPMTKLDYLPRYQEGQEYNQFLYFTWQSNELRFLPANQDNDIKLDYIRSLFPIVTDEDDDLPVINAQSFLQFRTAGLLAEFLAENATRAMALNGDASLAIDRSLGIGTKGRQAINIRHRPFRASYKRKSYL
jgi:hypothetical protein